MDIQQLETGEMASRIISAYLRTSMCLIFAGAAFFESSNTLTSNFTGWLFIVSGVAAFAFGAVHRMRALRPVRLHLAMPIDRKIPRGRP